MFDHEPDQVRGHILVVVQMSVEVVKIQTRWNLADTGAGAIIAIRRQTAIGKVILAQIHVVQRNACRPCEAPSIGTIKAVALFLGDITTRCIAAMSEQVYPYRAVLVDRLVIVQGQALY